MKGIDMEGHREKDMLRRKLIMESIGKRSSDFFLEGSGINKSIF